MKGHIRPAVCMALALSAFCAGCASGAGGNNGTTGGTGTPPAEESSMNTEDRITETGIDTGTQPVRPDYSETDAVNIAAKINNKSAGAAVMVESDVYTVYDPDRDSAGYYYNFYPEIIRYNGLFIVSWCSGRRNEDDFGQRIMTSYSTDLVSWSAPVILFDPAEAGDGNGAFINSGFTVYGGRLYAYGYVCRTTGAEPGKNSTLSDPVYFFRCSDDGMQWGDMTRTVRSSCYNSKKLLSGRFLTFGRGSLTSYTDRETGNTGMGLGWNDAAIDMADAIKRGAGTLMESSFYQTDDGVVFMMFRTNTKKLWCSISCNEGESWSKVYPTGFTDAISKSRFGRLPDGRIFYVGNPFYDAGFTRNPLMLCISSDGLNFSEQYVLRNEKDYRMKVDGLFKEGDFGYPCVITDDRYMYVFYARRKETLEITRVALKDI